MNKKGVDVRFFFSDLAVFKFGTKVVMLLMNASFIVARPLC